jgi:hypothetical protein
MTDSQALLLYCLRKEPEVEKIARLQSYTGQNWEDIIDTAFRHNVTPILFHTLKPFFPVINISDQFKNKLRICYFYSSARNLRLIQQLLQIIAILNREGIPLILLKGAHLANLVYENSALRPMSDIDLLAKKGDLPKIHRLLLANGFRNSEAEQGAILRHMAPYHKGKLLTIEIHYHIATLPEKDSFDIAELWERAQQHTLQGLEVLTLSPEDLLLHLCHHTAVQHGFNNGLVPYFDLASGIKHYGDKLSWETLINRAEQWGFARSVKLMLALTDRLIGLSLPEEICQAIKSDREVEVALDTAQDFIFDKSLFIEPLVASLFERKSWRMKLKLFIQRAFPSIEVVMMGKNKTNNNLLKVYWLYFLHIQNRYRKHGKVIWQSLLKNPEIIAVMEKEIKRNNLRDWLTQSNWRMYK